MDNDVKSGLIAVGLGFIGIVAAIIVFGSWYIVSPGEVAINTRLGKIVGAYSSGIHLKLPVVDSIKKFSVLVQRADMETQVFSKDLQTITVKLAINYRINEGNVADIYSNLGLDYVQTVVDPTIQEVLKSITAKYSADEIISNRPQIVAELNEIAQKRLLDYKIIVTQLAIADMDFNKEFLNAVEAKQIAEQTSKRAEKLVTQYRMEKEQMIEKARGEAESLRLQREQVTPQLIELRKVEASIKAIEKWDGHLSTYSGGGAVPFISIGK